MKKYLRNLAIVMLIVPVMFLMAACGGTVESRFKLSSLKMGAVTIDLTDAEAILAFIETSTEGMEEMPGTEGLPGLTIPEGEERARFLNIVEEAINALNIVVRENEFAISFKVTKFAKLVIQQVMDAISEDEGGVTEGEEDAAEGGEDVPAVESNMLDGLLGSLDLENIPSIESALIFQYRMDGTTVVLLDTEGEDIVLDEDVFAITKTEDKIEVTITDEELGLSIVLGFEIV